MDERGMSRLPITILYLDVGCGVASTLLQRVTWFSAGIMGTGIKASALPENFYPSTPK
jgi:hypothetical protein